MIDFLQTPDIKVTKDKYLFGGNGIKAMKRDNFKCVKCGMTMEEHKKRWGLKLAVDHIDHKGTTVPRKERNNNINNLQTLCFSCHGKKDTESYSKRVAQFDLKGNFIQEFKSIGEAARFFKRHKSNLTHYLAGKGNKTFAGYIWRLAKEEVKA